MLCHARSAAHLLPLVCTRTNRSGKQPSLRTWHLRGWCSLPVCWPCGGRALQLTQAMQAAGSGSASAPEEAAPETFRLHVGRLHPDAELRRMFGGALRIEEDDEADGAPCVLRGASGSPAGLQQPSELLLREAVPLLGCLPTACNCQAGSGRCQPAESAQARHLAGPQSA